MAEWCRCWSRKPEIPGSIPGQPHFSFSLYIIYRQRSSFNLILNSRRTPICPFSPSHWHPMQNFEVRWWPTKFSSNLLNLYFNFVVYFVPKNKRWAHVIVNHPNSQSILIRYNAVFTMRLKLSCQGSTVKWRHSSFFIVNINMACSQGIMGNIALLLLSKWISHGSSCLEGVWQWLDTSLVY